MTIQNIFSVIRSVPVTYAQKNGTRAALPSFHHSQGLQPLGLGLVSWFDFPNLGNSESYEWRILWMAVRNRQKSQKNSVNTMSYSLSGLGHWQMN